MNFLIIESKKGITLSHYSSTNLPIDETMISGLISALNELTMVEFKQPIQSVNMGGFKWIYSVDDPTNVLFVMSDFIDISTDVIKGRLNFLKMLFLRNFVSDAATWKNKWTGDIEQFQGFRDTVEEYYNQWTTAGNVDTLALFYDSIGIFQEFLNLMHSAVDLHAESDVRTEINEEISKIFTEFMKDPEMKKEPELSKISYSIEEGYDIFEINPIDCDANFIISKLGKLVKSVGTTIKEKMGYKNLLSSFIEEGIMTYIYNNLDLIKKLNIDSMIFKLILTF